MNTAPPVFPTCQVIPFAPRTVRAPRPAGFTDSRNPGLTAFGPSRAEVWARAVARLEQLDAEQIQVVELVIVAIARGAQP